MASRSRPNPVLVPSSPRGPEPQRRRRNSADGVTTEAANPSLIPWLGQAISVTHQLRMSYERPCMYDIIAPSVAAMVERSVESPSTDQVLNRVNRVKHTLL